MYGVFSTLPSYLRRISDVRVAYLAYQWRMCYVCATYISLLWSMCDVLGILGIFCGIPRESLMLLYKCFRSSEIMDQMGWHAGFFQGYAWCSPLSLFMTSYNQDGELGDVPPPPPLGFFFGVNLDYLDFSSGIFGL